MNLAVVDLDRDSLKDIVPCDAKLNEIRWIRQSPAGTYVDKKLGSKVRGPAHVEAFDLDMVTGG